MKIPQYLTQVTVNPKIIINNPYNSLHSCLKRARLKLNSAQVKIQPEEKSHNLVDEQETAKDGMAGLQSGNKI